jgi:hypothetical protein
MYSAASRSCCAGVPAPVFSCSARGTNTLSKRRLLVARGFREVKAHESDEGVDVLDCHGLHVAELRSRDVDRGDVVKSRMESFLKLRHVLRPQSRSLCGIDAPVTGYKRKISVHADVPLSGESTLIFENTL